MVNRYAVVATVAAALLASGCSNKVEVPRTTKSLSAQVSSTSAKPTKSATETESPSASKPLDSSACAEVTQANLDLALASTGDEARKPADILLKYNPPSSVAQAIEHFVGTGGAQFDDPDFQTNNDKVEKWVKEVCP